MTWTIDHSKSYEFMIPSHASSGGKMNSISIIEQMISGYSHYMIFMHSKWTCLMHKLNKWGKTKREYFFNEKPALTCNCTIKFPPFFNNWF